MTNDCNTSFNDPAGEVVIPFATVGPWFDGDVPTGLVAEAFALTRSAHDLGVAFTAGAVAGMGASADVEVLGCFSVSGAAAVDDALGVDGIEDSFSAGFWLTVPATFCPAA